MSEPATSAIAPELDRAPGPASDPAVVHETRAAAFGARAEAEKERARTLSTARLVLFVGAAAAFLGAHDMHGAWRLVLAASGVALGVGFLVLVHWHRRTLRQRDWLQELKHGSELALARRRRDWGALPPPVPREAPEDHAYAADLDVFGRASLAQLLGSVATAPGRERLHAWLSAPAPAREARERQEAVAELAPMLELREELSARGRLAGRPDAERVRALLAWAGGAPWLRPQLGLRVLAWLVPAATLGLLALQLAGVLHDAWWGIGVFAAALVTGRTIRPIHGIYGRASAGKERIAGYAAAFELLSRPDFRAAALHRVRDELNAEGGAASALRRLDRILALADTRESNLAYLAVQLFLLWDLHVLAALERWQATSGQHVAGWLRALGEAEALAALAGLAHDHPDWRFPELVEPDPGSPAAFRAEALGHPLLPPEQVVRNDVAVGPPGTFLLVTGSNMSGKSTLLRAIGLNAVLARAGGPVCASALALPPIELWTSIRVVDSLERGLSHFMAELERLKAIVDAARRVEAEGDRRLLYLVDEVLQGTNSAERQVAARHILRHLLAHGAIGAVTTHDLELADSPELRQAAVAVHFRETVHADGETPPLSFDYRLRPGVATSRNALKLMEIVGLGSAG